MLNGCAEEACVKANERLSLPVTRKFRGVPSRSAEFSVQRGRSSGSALLQSGPCTGLA